MFGKYAGISIEGVITAFVRWVANQSKYVCAAGVEPERFNISLKIGNAGKLERSVEIRVLVHVHRFGVDI